MPSVVCPHCHHGCSADQLLLSCVPPCGPDTTPFPAGGLRRGRCAHGRAPQARRTCPTCRSAIPREYVEAGGRVIVVVGAARAGKSAWATAVIRQLTRGETAYAMPGLSVSLLGAGSRARYAALDRMPPERTSPAEPLLISVRLPTSTRPVVLALREVPGDDCAPDRIDRLEPYLSAAAGVVLLLDPIRLPGVRRVIGLNPRPPEPVLPLAALPHRPRTPVAVALTKLDLMWDMFDSGSPLRQPSPHCRRYVEWDGLDVHHEVESWLARWGPADLLAGHPGRYRCFALSALGGAHRVVDPLLWLLTRFGALDVTKGRR